MLLYRGSHGIKTCCVITRLDRTEPVQDNLERFNVNQVQHELRLSPLTTISRAGTLIVQSIHSSEMSGILRIPDRLNNSIFNQDLVSHVRAESHRRPIKAVLHGVITSE
jgi:hypothetical protein